MCDLEKISDPLRCDQPKLLLRLGSCFAGFRHGLVRLAVCFAGFRHGLVRLAVCFVGFRHGLVRLFAGCFVGFRLPGILQSYLLHNLLVITGLGQSNMAIRLASAQSFCLDFPLPLPFALAFAFAFAKALPRPCKTFMIRSYTTDPHTIYMETPVHAAKLPLANCRAALASRASALSRRCCSKI